MITDKAELAALVSRLFASSISPVSAEQAASLAAYLALLLKWSRRINLTGFRDAASAAEGLLYDAGELAPMLGRGAAVLDVGAGAGGLAVALAVLRADITLTLVEPRVKRAVFLRTLRRELGLVDRMTVVEARAEELEVEHQGAEASDVAYAQAVMPPEKWLPLGATLVRPGGAVVALTARALAPHQVPAELAVVDERTYRLPDSGAPRVVTKLESQVRAG